MQIKLLTKLNVKKIQIYFLLLISHTIIYPLILHIKRQAGRFYGLIYSNIHMSLYIGLAGYIYAT